MTLSRLERHSEQANPAKPDNMGWPAINAFENMKKQLPSKWFGGDPTWMAIPDSAAVYGPIRHRQPVRSARREGKLTRDLPENVSIAGP